MTIIRQDDLDQSTDGVSTHTFTFDGVEYEIDLCAANYAALAEALRPDMIRKKNASTLTVTVKPVRQSRQTQLPADAAVRRSRIAIAPTVRRVCVPARC